MYRTRLLLVLLFSFVGFFYFGDAEACSLVPPNTVLAPSNEKSYDAQLSPDVPEITVARLSSLGGHGCGSSDCGDIDLLVLEVRVPAGTDRLRVDIEGEPTIYLSPSVSQTGQLWDVRDWGYGEYNELALEIRTINSDGYVSMPALVTAVSDGDSGGCNTTGNSTSNAIVLLACLFLWLQIRRRKLKNGRFPSADLEMW